jgi:hypothetical protein
MEEIETNIGVFTIKNGSQPLNAWVFQHKKEKPIFGSIEDLNFINHCQNGDYDPYDGMRIKASYKSSGSQVLIEKVYLVG